MDALDVVLLQRQLSHRAQERWLLTRTAPTPGSLPEFHDPALFSQLQVQEHDYKLSQFPLVSCFPNSRTMGVVSFSRWSRCKCAGGGGRVAESLN